MATGCLLTFLREMDLLCLGGKVGDYEIGIFKTGIPQQFSPAVSPGITTLSDFRVKAYF